MYMVYEWYCDAGLHTIGWYVHAICIYIYIFVCVVLEYLCIYGYVIYDKGACMVKINI